MSSGISEPPSSRGDVFGRASTITRWRVRAIFSASAALILLVSGLAISFLDLGGSYRIGLDAAVSTTASPPTIADTEMAGIRLRPDDRYLVAEGRRLYSVHCASCHGTDLEGQANWKQPGPGGIMPAPPHDSNGHTWHHPDSMLFAITKFGGARTGGANDVPSTMPAYETTLSDEEIIATLSFIKSRWPADIRDRHDVINLRQVRP